MLIIRCALWLVLIGLAGCATPKPQPASEWVRVTTALDEIPLGMDVREIERRLSLPPPFKTVLGSGDYHDRVFVYRVPPDIILSLGLRQVGPEIERESGVFRYNGHHGIRAGDDLYWNRWEFTNSDAPVESWKGLAHLKPEIGDRWPPEGAEATTTERAASAMPTPTALWAHRQVESLLAGDPHELAKQLQAIAVVEVDDSDSALPMDLRREELESLWARVRDKYDTDWVAGYMIEDKRAMFVHTLLALYVRDRAPALYEEMPGAFDADAQRWPAWLESHKAQLGMN
jgi:hypothetical protein